MDRSLKAWGAAVLIAVVVVLHWCSVARAQTEDLSALNQQVVRLYQAGKYTEAIGVAQRLLALAERQFGPDHPDAGTSLNNLALLYQAQGRYGEAEPLLRRALALRENALGRDHPNVDESLNNLAELYRELGRYGAALGAPE
jgi:tetratricopeptide (TPR) repeat protein